MDANGRLEGDIVIRNGQQKGLFNRIDGKTGKSIIGGVIASEQQLITDMDLWSLTLFLIPRERYTVSEYLDVHPCKVSVDSGTERGLRWVELEFESHDKALCIIRFNSAVNYLVDRLVMKMKRQDTTRVTSVRSEYRVLEYHELAPGIFFPKSVALDHYENEMLLVKHEYELSELKYEPTVPSTAFDLTFPAGTRVTDKIRGIEYTTGSDERPAGATKKYAPTVSVSGGDQGQTPLSADDPSSWTTRRIIWIGSALVLVAGTYFVIRARRRPIEP